MDPPGTGPPRVPKDADADLRKAVRGKAAALERLHRGASSSRSRSPSPMTEALEALEALEGGDLGWREAGGRRRRDDTVEAVRAQAREAIRRREGEVARQAWCGGYGTRPMSYRLEE